MGEINFNKLSFNEKVQIATQNLEKQGKAAPTTSDIVNEMVRLAQANKTSASELPEGFQIERTAAYSDILDTVIEMYGVIGPGGWGEMPKDIDKFLTAMWEILPNIDKFPEEARNEIVKVLEEYVDALRSSDTPNINVEPYVLYGTPAIESEVAKRMMEFVGKLKDLNLPQELIKEILSKISEGIISPENLNKLVETLTELLKNANIPQEQISDIINGAINVFVLESKVLYGTPDVWNRVNDEDVKRVLDFAKQLFEMDIPDDIKQSILDTIVNAVQNKDDIDFQELLDTLLNHVKDERLSEESRAQLTEMVMNLLNEINLLGTTYVLYGTPNIPKDVTNIVRELMQKILPDINELTSEWKEVLANMIEGMIAIIKGDKVPGSTGIANNTTAKSLEGTQKILVTSEEDFYKDHPADKFEIVHKMPMGTTRMMIFFKSKE